MTHTYAILARRGAFATIPIIVAGLIGLAAPAGAGAVQPAPEAKPTVVLVHGAFADATGWSGVVKDLQRGGYPVLAPANPLRGLPGDTAYLKSVLDTIDGPIVLVGHSYGGMVLTNAATGDSDVQALVYVAAFAPDEGDSTGSLSSMFAGSMLTPENLTFRTYPRDDETTGTDGYITPDVFAEVFAADLPRRTTDVMAATQRPADTVSLEQPSGPPAWETIPSWFVIAKQDNAIPAKAQRFMAERAGAVETVELRTSHVAMIAKPHAVAKVIIDAARATG